MTKIPVIADRVIRICFALLAVVVPLVLTPWNYELFEYNKMMVVYGITAVIALAWVSKMIAQKRIFIAKTPIDIPIGLLAISHLVSTLFSMDPHVSWFGYYSRFNGGMLSIVSYILLFYAFVSNISQTFLPTLTKLLLATGSLVAAYGIAEHFGIDKNLWIQDVQSRVFSTLGQPNWLAAYMAALIPVALAIAFANKAAWAKAAQPAGITILFFLTLLFTRSRSGLLAFVIADILFWALLLIKTKSAVLLRAPFILMHVIFFFIVFFTGTHIDRIDKYASFTGLKETLTHIKQDATQSAEIAQPAGPVLEIGGTESGTIRTFVWQAAINAWKSSPKTMLIGTGTETFAFAFYQYKPIGHNMTSEWDFLYNKAHNEYLNILATTGLFGLVSYLLVIGSISLWSIRTILHPAEIMQGKKKKAQTAAQPHPFIIYIGIVSGWITILITNFFGFSVVITQLLFVLLPAAMYLLSQNQMMYREKTLKIAQKTQRIMLIIFLAGTAGTLTFLGIIWFADKTFTSGYRLSRAGQYAASYTHLSRAITMNPREPLYHDEYANSLASLALAAYENEDATLAATLGHFAIQENDQAIAISPNNVNFWKTKTKILYALSSLDEAFLPLAMNALKQSQLLSPYDPKIPYNLAILSGKTGSMNDSIDYLKQAIALKPNYRDAYYALFVFYKENKQPKEARDIITTYLTTVDSRDEEFLQLTQ